MESKAAVEAAAKDTTDRKADKKSYAKEGAKRKITSEKVVPGTNSLWPALLFSILLAMLLLYKTCPEKHTQHHQAVLHGPAAGALTHQAPGQSQNQGGQLQGPQPGGPLRGPQQHQVRQGLQQVGPRLPPVL